jgi:Uma2 family endonuclease
MDVFVDDWNVLQPDVLVIRPEVLAEADTEGPGIPLLVVEVLSPSTARRDRSRKTRIYLRAAVCEVWLVDPSARTIELHTTAGVERFAGEARAASAAIPGFTLAWTDLDLPRAPGGG